jgi:hypothetical protein
MSASFGADTVRVCHPKYCTDRYLRNLADTARLKIWILCHVVQSLAKSASAFTHFRFFRSLVE